MDLKYEASKLYVTIQVVCNYTREIPQVCAMVIDFTLQSMACTSYKLHELQISFLHMFKRTSRVKN